MSPSPYYCCWVSWEKRRDFTTTISSQFLHLFFSPFFYIFRLLIHRFQKLSEWIKFFFSSLFSFIYIFYWDYYLLVVIFCVVENSNNLSKVVKNETMHKPTALSFTSTKCLLSLHSILCWLCALFFYYENLISER
jgi:hypothetical protein